MSKKRAIVSALAIAPMIAGGAAIASPAWAGPEQPKACALFAGNVAQHANQVSGSGGRQGCGNQANVAVAEYKDITAWPDTRIASVKRNGITNINLGVAGQCDGNGAYYIYTTSSTGGTFRGQDSTPLC